MSGELNVPKHVAIILDGNGRWAKAKGLPRNAGHVQGAKVVGPCGELELTEGVIAAKRHIHMTPSDAEEFCVEDKQIVSVKIDSDERSLIFGDVVVRVSEKFALAMHIDTDESNACGAAPGMMVEILDKCCGK